MIWIQAECCFENLQCFVLCHGVPHLRQNILRTLPNCDRDSLLVHSTAQCSLASTITHIAPHHAFRSPRIIGIISCGIPAKNLKPSKFIGLQCVPERLKNLFDNNPHQDSNPHFNLVAFLLSMTSTQTHSCNFLAVKQPAVIPRFFGNFFFFYALLTATL